MTWKPWGGSRSRDLGPRRPGSHRFPSPTWPWARVCALCGGDDTPLAGRGAGAIGTVTEQVPQRPGPSGAQEAGVISVVFTGQTDRKRDRQPPRSTWKASAICHSRARVFSLCLSTMSLARIAFPADGETALEPDAGARGPSLGRGEPHSALTALVLQLHAAGPERLQGQAHVVHLLQPADGGHAQPPRQVPAVRQQLHRPPEERERGHKNTRKTNVAHFPPTQLPKLKER